MPDLSFGFESLRLDLSVMDEQSIGAVEPSLRVQVGLQIELWNGSIVFTLDDIWFDRPAWDGFVPQLDQLLLAKAGSAALRSSDYESDVLDLQIRWDKAGIVLSVRVRVLPLLDEEQRIEFQHQVGLAVSQVQSLREGFAYYPRWW